LLSSLSLSLCRLFTVLIPEFPLCWSFFFVFPPFALSNIRIEQEKNEKVEEKEKKIAQSLFTPSAKTFPY
jgi:hypothetical protein